MPLPLVELFSNFEDLRKGNGIRIIRGADNCGNVIDLWF
jgi:hypothetical protein